MLIEGKKISKLQKKNRFKDIIQSFIKGDLYIKSFLVLLTEIKKICNKVYWFHNFNECYQMIWNSNGSNFFTIVRMLREELQLLQEQGSYVGEVVKAMDKKKVLVKV